MSEATHDLVGCRASVLVVSPFTLDVAQWDVGAVRAEIVVTVISIGL